MGSEDTPPSSPGIPVTDDGDELFEDDIAEEIDIVEGEAQVKHPSFLVCRS